MNEPQHVAEVLEDEDEPDVLEELLQKANSKHGEFLKFLIDRGERYEPED